jgi:hypothetical protein
MPADLQVESLGNEATRMPVSAEPGRTQKSARKRAALSQVMSRTAGARLRLQQEPRLRSVDEIGFNATPSADRLATGSYGRTNTAVAPPAEVGVSELLARSVTPAPRGAPRR